MAKGDTYKCQKCGYKWKTRKEEGSPARCPGCNDKNISNVSRAERIQKKKNNRIKSKQKEITRTKEAWRERNRKRTKKGVKERLISSLDTVLPLKLSKESSKELENVPSVNNPNEEFTSWKNSQSDHEKMIGLLGDKLSNCGMNEYVLFNILYRMKSDIKNVQEEEIAEILDDFDGDDSLGEIVSKLDFSQYHDSNEETVITLLRKS